MSSIFNPSTWGRSHRSNPTSPTTPTTPKDGKRKAPDDHATERPILNDQDEEFLEKLAAAGDDIPPPLPARPEASSTDAQVVLMQGADHIPLPDVPDTPEGVMPGIEGGPDAQTKDMSASQAPSTSSGISGYFHQAQTRSRQALQNWSWASRDSREKSRKTTSEDLDTLATSLKHDELKEQAKAEKKHLSAYEEFQNESLREEEEMRSALEQLNLAAINNRVFSISKESSELLAKFNLVLKDLVAGAPTAYKDLENLLTGSNDQIEKMYKSLPSFMQEIIQKLPMGIGPELLATAAEKHGISQGHVNKAWAMGEKKAGRSLRMPSLQELVAANGAIATTLRSIMSALRTRFPAFVGLNVLWSLALTVLLLVLWYCHKRGREDRLESERKADEAETADIAARVAADGPYQPPEAASGTAGSTGATAPETVSRHQIGEVMDEASRLEQAEAQRAVDQAKAAKQTETSTVSSK